MTANIEPLKKVPADAPVVIWRPRRHLGPRQIVSAIAVGIVFPVLLRAAGVQRQLPVNAWIGIGVTAASVLFVAIGAYAGRQTEPTLAADSSGFWWRRRRVRRLPWSAVANVTAQYTWFGRAQLRLTVTPVAVDSEPSLPRMIKVPLGNCRRRDGPPVPPNEVLLVLRQLGSHRDAIQARPTPQPIVIRRRYLGDHGRVFAADQRGVWYMAHGRRLQFAPWSAVGWIAERRDVQTRSLVIGSSGDPLPGTSGSRQVEIVIISRYWGLSSSTNLEPLLRDLYELSGGRVKVR
ncbi:hypothetical protein [Fodinicola acaciae]|uniref:hypothetical protein n=1 Tax=Fodinicola acaciae TaxID=2681555 RepID=UPI0013D8C98A|nr:hypothetical protein [Fodinicola acaciae]